MSAQAILTLVAVALATGCVVGFAVGSRRGRDAQYCDDYFATVARDRARRNRLGQYKAKEARIV